MKATFPINLYNRMDQARKKRMKKKISGQLDKWHDEHFPCEECGGAAYTLDEIHELPEGGCCCNKCFQKLKAEGVF